MLVGASAQDTYALNSHSRPTLGPPPEKMDILRAKSRNISYFRYLVYRRKLTADSSNKVGGGIEGGPKK